MSSIKSALILDDKQFQTAIKNATTSAEKFGKTVEQSAKTSSAALDKLSAAVGGVQTKLSGLNNGLQLSSNAASSFATALAGIGMVSFLQNVFNTSSAVKDMSTGFGLSVATTLELKAGFDKAGVSVETMTKVLNTLALSSDDAQAGNAKLQVAFEKLGIKAGDLGKLTLAEKMYLIGDAMNKAGGSTESLRAATDLLGKGALQLVGKWDDLTSGYVAASGTMDEMASKTLALDEANKKIEQSAQKIKDAFVNVFGDYLADIATFVADTNNAEIAAKALGGAMLLIAGGTIANAIKGIIGLMASLAGAFGLGAAAASAETVAIAANTASVGANAAARMAGLAAKVASLEATIAEARATQMEAVSATEAAAAKAVEERITWRLAVAKGALAEATGVATAATAAGTAATTASATAMGALLATIKGVLTAMAALAARLALIVVAIEAINEAIKFAFKVDPIEFFADKLENLIHDNFPTLYEWLEKIGDWFGMAPGKIKKTADEMKKIQGGGDGKRMNAAQDPRVVGTAPASGAPARNEGDTAQGGTTKSPWLAQVEALKQQYDLAEKVKEQELERLKLQGQLVGASQLEVATRTSALDFIQKKKMEEAKIDADIAKLKTQIAQGDEAAAKTLGPQVAELERQKKLISEEVDLRTAEVTKIQQLKEAEASRLYFSDLQLKTAQQLYNMEQAAADFSRSENDRKLAAIQAQIKAEEDAAVKRRQGELGNTAMDPAEELAIRQRVADSMQGLIDKQKTLNEEQAKSEAFKFAQDLQNTAIQEGIRIRAQLAELTMTEDERQINALKTQNALLAEQEIARRRAKLAPGEDISESEKAGIRAAVNSANAKQLSDTQALIDKSREWSTGWDKAFKDYASNAGNSAKQAQTYFESFTKGFEDAFVKFVQTGKLSFKDLVNDMIAQFARIQAQKMISSIGSSFGGGSSGGGGFSLGGLWDGIKSILPFADGGSPPVGVASLVGERGPELFVPKSAGTIIPNEALGGTNQTINQITYNINATDAQSFKQQLARDPSFVHAVVEQGRRSTPGAARR